MTAAVLMRDVTIGLRTRAFAAALAVHAALLAGFIVLWGGGVPMLPGANFYEQQRLVQMVLLVCLLPWAAARCGAGDRGSDLALLSAVAAVRPSRIVMTQFAALLVLLAVVVITGFPLMVMAREVAAVPVRAPVSDMLPALGIAAIAASSTVWWTLGQADRLAAWLGATASTIVTVTAVAWLLPYEALGPGLFVISVAGAAACAARADVSLVYLQEQRP